MSCFSPIQAFSLPSKNLVTGKSVIVFKSSDSRDEPIVLPCGRCIGCRLERSRQWALRCIHEASLHESNCFITLTYDDSHLPADCSLNLDHFQRFMKRLRKKYGNGIRFFHCGEYGEKFGRPHYHALIFGFDFPDKVFWKESNKIPLYRSASLEKLWTYGYSSIGDVTFESAAYVARYIMKKITGPGAWTHYLDIETGVIKKPEYTTMSRRPGIAAGWYDKFRSDVYPHDFTVLRGRKVKPPKFYDRLFEAKFPADFERIKERRKADSLKRVVSEFGTANPLAFITKLRSAVKERCKSISIERLVRVVE